MEKRNLPEFRNEGLQEGARGSSPPSRAWEWEWEEANGVERKWVRAGGKNLVGESLRRFRSELCFGFFQAESLLLD